MVLRGKGWFVVDFKTLLSLAFISHRSLDSLVIRSLECPIYRKIINEGRAR